MASPLTKLKLSTDWGVRKSKRGNILLHGRVYRNICSSEEQYLFVCASYNGSNIRIQAWECNPNGKHAKEPLYSSTNMNINQFLDLHGYIIVDHAQYKRHATLLDVRDMTTASGEPVEVATYHVSPAIGGAYAINELTVTTQYVGTSTIKRISTTYTDGETDQTDSIGWETDAQALTRIGIRVIDADEVRCRTTANALLEQAMIQANDSTDIICRIDGNWGGIIDTRIDDLDLTAWSEKNVYTYTNDQGVGMFKPLRRNPPLTNKIRKHTDVLVREGFVNGVAGNIGRDEAIRIFESWLKAKQETTSGEA